MARVIKPWTDLKDEKHIYYENNEFPREDVTYEVTPQRLKELADGTNQRNEKLIELNDKELELIKSLDKDGSTETVEDTETGEPSESLEDLNVGELKALAKEKGLTGYSKLTHEELVKLLSE
ncbi:hypothetical protein [Macrococcus capreoli]|uniref:hypothetical protein n=1 Tax=Macrococcus capreoli TaxID=2982690 RepID=UPI003EE6FCD9